MRTKIIATLGPASMNKETMTDMARHGVRIFRFNFSHSDAAAFKPIVDIVREIEAELGSPLTAMGDLCGPKTRVGEVAGSPLQLEKESFAVLGLPEAADKACDGMPFIPLDFPELLKGLQPGMPVSLSDGMLQFTVTEIIEEDRCFVMQANNSGMLTSNKGIAFPGKFHPVPAMTPKDRKDVKEGLEIGLDAFALSFVQTADDVADLKNEIRKYGHDVPVVAKIERQNAVDNIESILELADAIMVARGDLGLEAAMHNVPVIQKRLIRAARHAQKGCIVATQMLLSMVRNPCPTRAEAADVANAIFDGADCVMLSEETAMGSYPCEAVRFMHNLAMDAEAYFIERLQGPYFPKKERNPAKYLAYSATLLADNISSAAIVSHSSGGNTARLLSSRRPAQYIYALTPDQVTVRKLNFFWGVRPRLVTTEIEGHMERAEHFIQNSDEFSPGCDTIITSGQPTPGNNSPHTNAIKIYCK